MPFTHDALIIGQGLAGTVLSETLATRGLSVMVFDARQVGSASHVAAGVVNPIVLRRTLPSWRASEMLAVAGAYYRELELDQEAHYWKPLPFVEIFPTAQEAAIWQLRMRDAEHKHMLSSAPVSDASLEKLPHPYGYGVVLRCAWLNLQAMMADHRERLIASGALEERIILESDIIRKADGIEVLGRSAPLLVHCGGPFNTVPGLVPVRGEGLTVRLPGLGMNCMVHRGAFIVPMGDDVYRVGSTFAWDDVWSGPTDEGKRHLLDRLHRLWSGPIEVLDHWAGVRPASKDRRPIMGRTGPHEAVLSGFGARGGLLAPWCAAHLADHLLNGKPLDPEVDVQRFA